MKKKTLDYTLAKTLFEKGQSLNDLRKVYDASESSLYRYKRKYEIETGSKIAGSVKHDVGTRISNKEEMAVLIQQVGKMIEAGMTYQEAGAKIGKTYGTAFNYYQKYLETKKLEPQEQLEIVEEKAAPTPPTPPKEMVQEQEQKAQLQNVWNEFAKDKQDAATEEVEEVKEEPQEQPKPTQKPIPPHLMQKPKKQRISNNYKPIEKYGSSFSAFKNVIEKAVGEPLKEVEPKEEGKTFMIDNKNTKFERGDIVTVYDITDGKYTKYMPTHVQELGRPAIVIQNNLGNHYSENLIVCLLTTKIKRLEMPTHVLITSDALEHTSMLMAEQILTVSKSCVLKKGRVSDETMAEVDRAIQVSLKLDGDIPTQATEPVERVVEVEKEVITLPKLNRLKMRFQGVFDYVVGQQLEIIHEGVMLQLEKDNLEDLIAELEEIKGFLG